MSPGYGYGIGETFTSNPSTRGGGGGETKFVMEVTIPSDGYTVKLSQQTAAGYTINYNVDWGDGNTDSGNTAMVSHVYDTGVYDIKIDGDWAPRLQLDVPTRTVVTKLKNWGKDTTTFTGFDMSFRDCANMEYEATDYPTLNLVPSKNSNYTFLNVATPTFTGVLDLSLIHI